MPTLTRRRQTISDIGEFGLIDIIKAKSTTSNGVIQGIGDDTAVLSQSKGHLLLLTTDMLLEGVHFALNDSPVSIGHKALGCSISDIASMGGLASYAVVSVGLPAQTDLEFVKDMYKGMTSLAKKFNVQIVGGDTVKSQKIIINVTLLGKIKKRDLVTRKGARLGDQIFVTGALGGSLRRQKHLNFMPRIKESQFLVRNYKPSSMIDVSDGLSADLGHILKASHVGATLLERDIPIASGARLEDALHDGEDFELIFTLPKIRANRLKKVNRKNLKFYHIGSITPQRGLRILRTDGRLKKAEEIGFTHF